MATKKKFATKIKTPVAFLSDNPQVPPPVTPSSVSLSEPKDPLRRKIKKILYTHKKVIGALTVIILFVGVIVSAATYITTKMSEKPSVTVDTQKEEKSLSQKEAEGVLKALGNIFRLPESETPKILTISGINDKKREDPFYRYAENGDIIAVYTEAGRAILFRPSTNQVIEVGKVEKNSQNAQQVAGVETEQSQNQVTSPKPSPTPKDVEEITLDSEYSVEIRFAPDQKDQAEEVKAKIEELLQSATISLVETENNPGSTNQIIDKNGNKPKVLEELATWTGLDITEDITASESNSKADFIIRIN